MDLVDLVLHLRKRKEWGALQDPPGQGPMQPALGDLASAGGLD